MPRFVLVVEYCLRTLAPPKTIPGLLKFLSKASSVFPIFGLASPESVSALIALLPNICVPSSIDHKIRAATRAIALHLRPVFTRELHSKDVEIRPLPP